jgi:hypothetical protein
MAFSFIPGDDEALEPADSFFQKVRTRFFKLWFCSIISEFLLHLFAGLWKKVYFSTLLEQPERKRLRRHLPNDLPTRFMV